MQRLRNSGGSIFGSLARPQLKKKALNSWSAVQDTYFSTKDTFERHRVVFTISTSLASVATAWIGYSLRYLHQAKVEQKLESIEEAMKRKHSIEDSELKKIVNSGNSSSVYCMATAGTTLVIGYGLGWRGGRWYANRKFKKEQMKLLGQIKPKRWPQFQFLRKTLRRPKMPGSTVKAFEPLQEEASKAQNFGEPCKSC